MLRAAGFAAAALLIAAPLQASEALIALTLSSHNQAREAVGTPPLKWSAAAAEEAQRWADHLAQTGVLERDPDPRFGQNIWASTRPHTIDQVIAKAIADERSHYEPITGGCTDAGECRHYTQIVWSGTESVGCARAARPDAKYGQWEYWVCDYDPPGNWEGQNAY